MKYFDMMKPKTKKIKSICLESEPILESLEEHLVQEVDLMYHTFVIPRRSHLSSHSDQGFSFDMGDLSHNLKPIMEKKDEEDQNQASNALCDIHEELKEEAQNEGNLCQINAEISVQPFLDCGSPIKDQF